MWSAESRVFRQVPSTFQHPPGVAPADDLRRGEFASARRPFWRTGTGESAVIGISPAEPAIEGRIRAAQVDAIFRVTPLSLLVNVGTVALIVVTLRSAVDLVTLLLWVMMPVMLALLALESRGRGRTQSGRRLASARVFRQAALHAGMLGLAWGIVPLLWFPLLTTDQMMIVATVITGLIGAGGFALATVPAAASAYVVTLSLSAMGGVLLSNSTHRAMLVLMLVAYGATILRGVFGTARLFVDRFRAEAELEERQHVIALLLAEFEENGSDWLFELDATLVIVRPSSRFAQVAGVSDADLHGTVLPDLLDQASREQLLTRVQSGKPFRDLEVAAAGASSPRWWSLSASPMHDEHGRIAGWRGVGSDTTVVRTAQNEIAWMARTDILTGLANRTAFRERAAEVLFSARMSGQRVAIGCLDLDYFKSVNDTLGHAAGDVLLREVSHELMQFAEQGVIVGRLGGDEFGLLFHGISSSEMVQSIAERMIERLSRSYEIQGSRVSIGATLGLAFSPDDGDGVDELIRNADLALYRGKDNTRGQAVRYSALMQRDAEERRTIKEDLLQALRRQEFVLHYQPIIETDTGRTVAFEALVRWQHPTRGLLSPDAFIPIAESAGTIVPLGDWILRESCRQAAKWPKHVKVAVNLSPAQLGSGRLAQVVRDAIALARISPARVELEITESLLLSGDANALRFLTEMQGLGIGVALDGFGKGISSLNYLTRFPVSKIKIDRSFVSGGASHAHRSAIIQAVTGMAERLGFQTTAEGVESPETLAWVKALGCTQAQGYLFAKAMPASEVAAYLANELGATLPATDASSRAHTPQDRTVAC